MTLMEQFQAHGLPNYSDVPIMTAVRLTYDDAKDDGERMLRVGNWESFQVEKFFTLSESTIKEVSDGSSPAGDQ